MYAYTSYMYIHASMWYSSGADMTRDDAFVVEVTELILLFEIALFLYCVLKGMAQL